MKYLNLCDREELPSTLQALANVRVRRIPLTDTQNNTEYWISEDGKCAYVVHEICGKCYYDSIRIRPAGYRSRKSRPCFAYRKKNGAQINCTVDRAVYGAFILDGEMPAKRTVIPLVEYNLDDCSLKNILTDSQKLLRIQTNMEKYVDIYSKDFSGFVDFCEFRFGKDRQDALDIVSEAFLSMCEASITPKKPSAAWLKRIVKRVQYGTYRHTHVTLESLEELGIYI